MMRTFSSGVLGLQAYQTQMDVISNNIANATTNGYKKGRVLFESVLSQTMSGGAAPTSTSGGINPMQIGLGSRVGTIDNIFTQGTTQETGRDIDMMIQGEGFFVTSDANGTYYTRNGAFDLDSQLNLIHSVSSTKAKGWLATEDAASKNLSIDATKPTETLNFTKFQKLAAASTTLVEFASNLQMSATERSMPTERTLSFYDDKGTLQNLKVSFSKLDKNTWNWTAYDDTEGQVGSGSIKFDENGKIIEATGGPEISFDPDGKTGTPPSLKLQESNSAGITSATLKSLSASTYSMNFALSKGGVTLSDPSAKLSELYDATNANASAQFDLRNLDGDESLIVSGTDGDGSAVTDKEIKLTANMSVNDLITELKTVFPNSLPQFNATTGKIELVDASAGSGNALGNIKMNFVNPNNATSAVKFPGLTTSTTATAAQAGGFTQTLAGAGSVKSGVHSLSVSKVSPTPATITGVKTGLSRFTTFASLDIGDTSNFQISIDGGTAVKINGLSAGNYAAMTSANTVSAPPAGGYTAGSVTINGYQVSWTAAEVSALNQTQMGNFLSNKINSTFRNVFTAEPTNPNTVYANFDATTLKLSLSQMHRGSANKISIQSADAATGFDQSQTIAYGTDGSTISDLIDAINTQAGGAVAEMQSDRVVVKRAVNGPTYNVSILGVTSGTSTTYPAAPASQTDAANVFGKSSVNINEAIFGALTPQTVAGSEQAFNITDVFTPADATASVELKYSNVKDGQIIGNSSIGEIILNSSSFQPGTATITTTSEKNAGIVKISVPKINTYAAAFELSSGGQQVSAISAALITGSTHSVPMNIYDSTGYAHKITMNFEKVESGKWSYTTVFDASDPLITDYFKTHPISGTTPTSTELKAASAAVSSQSQGTIIFDKAGKIDSSATAAANLTTLPELAKPIKFTPTGANTVEFKPNFELVTQYDSEFSTGVKSSNGYEMGKLNGFLVDESGVIKGDYSNGQKITIAQMAIAKFINNGGLLKKSDSLYTEASNSGQAQIGKPGSLGRGNILSQNLEMSNVDLASEFTDMIVSQRGFQANSKTITTADQMLQEIIAIKR